MQYDTLRHIYYKEPKNHLKEYSARFNAPFAKHLEFEIKQIDRKDSYPAFFQYTEEIVNLLLAIEKRSKLVDEATCNLPNVAINQFLEQCFIEEIQATNDIEGVRSTKREIKDAVIDIKNGEKTKRFGSVISKYFSLLSDTSIDFRNSRDIRRFYDLFILEEVVNEDPDERPDGIIFRKDLVSIYKPSNKIIHRGLYPEKEIIKGMDYALQILNNSDIPKLVAIALFHYLFGYIHPFYNGNGRTVRFITTYYLKQEIALASCIRLSINIKKKRTHYYELFEHTTDEFSCGELTFFITEFLQIVLDNIDDTLSLVNKKYIQLLKWKEILSKKLDDWNINDKTTRAIYNVLLESVLFGGNGLTIDEIKKYIGVSRNTIDSRLSTIPKDHYIKDSSMKAYRYRLNSLILKNNKI